MSTTARDLINSSLRRIGALASGEPASASEATDGLTALNDLIDAWSNENLLIPNKVSETFALTSGQKTYTIGSTGNFNTTRPQKIENAIAQITSGSTTNDRPINILNQDQYAAITIKDVEAAYPTSLYCDYAYPLATISVWPVPNAACNLVLYSWKPLTDLATLDTAISLPPGYLRALKYNLAIELADEYGKQVSEVLALKAAESLATIKRMNSRPKYLTVDNALIGKPAAFNWITGEPT